MGKSITAMVPVRAGSQRVSNKNTRPFHNTSLLKLKLEMLKFLEGINEIVVSTDCEQAAEIAEKSGVNVQWRNEYFTSSTITNDLHWQHIAETTPGDIVFLAQVTSPLLRVRTMQNALNEFISFEREDSLNSVSVERKFLWENNTPINYDANTTPKSQDLPNIFSLNFAITIIDREVMKKRKNVVGYTPRFFHIDKVEALDIDDNVDFKLAELMFQELGTKWMVE